ncbi:hypothetical protein [Tomitella cavernea]|uniref:CopG family transcriptional regulator n=1 Tax=Tomitella cavernea TaxID=1387982 RepID=A0ABP9D3L1_9ACTN|nr:hypothetical protein [Tomitella cavernea]
MSKNPGKPTGVEGSDMSRDYDVHEYDDVIADLTDINYTVIPESVEISAELKLGRPPKLAGTPPAGPSPARTIRLGAALDRELTDYSTQAHVTISALLRTAAVEFLQRHPLPQRDHHG